MEGAPLRQSGTETSQLPWDPQTKHRARNLINALGLVFYVLEQQAIDGRELDCGLLEQGGETLQQLAKLIDGERPEGLNRCS